MIIGQSRRYTLNALFKVHIIRIAHGSRDTDVHPLARVSLNMFRFFMFESNRIVQINSIVSGSLRKLSENKHYLIMRITESDSC